MSSKITIIGAGSVGATIAYTLSQKSIASEIVLIDINKQKAEGEVMDIDQGTSFREPISIVAGDYPDAADSDIVIITSGIARKPGQTRIELTQTNVNIMKSITPEIVKVAPKALYIIVSNPCDIMTYAFAKISGLPERQILGSGTALDTARLRCRLSQHYGVSEKNIHAYVFGEHGDTSFVPWSRAFVAGATLDEFDKIVHEDQKDLPPLDREEVLEYVHTSGSTVIVKCLTDNINRTISQVRPAFTKSKAKLGAEGSVSYLYDVESVVQFKGMDEETAIDALIEGEVDPKDIETLEDGSLKITGEPTDYNAIKTAIENKLPDVEFDVDEIQTKPQETVELEGEDMVLFERLMNLLNDCDDVDQVYHNVSNYDDGEEE